jgi:hypothetical protein
VTIGTTAGSAEGVTVGVSALDGEAVEVDVGSDDVADGRSDVVGPGVGELGCGPPQATTASSSTKAIALISPR